MLWLENERIDRGVRRTHETEFLARVRYHASLEDFEQAERGVRAVFATLQDALGSPTGAEGEASGRFQPVTQGFEEDLALGARAERIGGQSARGVKTSCQST